MNWKESFLLRKIYLCFFCCRFFLFWKGICCTGSGFYRSRSVVFFYRLQMSSIIFNSFMLWEFRSIRLWGFRCLILSYRLFLIFFSYFWMRKVFYREFSLGFSIEQYVFLFALRSVIATYEVPTVGVLDSTIFLASGYEIFCLFRTVCISFSIFHFLQFFEYDECSCLQLA